MLRFKKTMFLFAAVMLMFLIAGCSKDTGRIYIEKVQSADNQSAFTGITLVDDDDYSMGSKDAPVIMVEFSDYQCPFCREFALKTLPKLEKEYIDTGKVRLVFKDFPIVKVHNNSVVAAIAADCAGAQGKYWEMHDLLFRKVEKWNTDSPAEDLAKLADSLNLDHGEYIACTSSEGHIEKINRDIKKGNIINVKGTPTFVINSVKVDGSLPYADYRTIIERELSK